MAPRPIPPGLAAQAFRTQAAREAGVSQKMLSGARFLRLHHGVYATKAGREEPGAYLEDKVSSLARDYLPLLREGEAFSHTTALLLHGAPIRTDPQLHVTSYYPQARARGRAAIGHQTRALFRPVMVASLLPCMSAPLALAQCGRLLAFSELVVAIDYLITSWSGMDNAGEPLNHLGLRAQLSHQRVPGIDRVRAACDVARVGAESRYESLAHFELARMGLDTLEMQANLFTRGGNWIGRFDMVDRARRKIIEFDGEQHRTDRRQYLKDITRLDLARKEGYDILRLHREDFHPQVLEQTRAQLCAFLEAMPRKVSPRLARYFAEPS